MDVRSETKCFVDYWRARPGAGGTKLDWVATWRNWMRKARPTRSTPGSVRERRSYDLAEPPPFVSLEQAAPMPDELRQRYLSHRQKED